MAHPRRVGQNDPIVSPKNNHRASAVRRISTALLRVAGALGLVALLVAGPAITFQPTDNVLTEQARRLAAERLGRDSVRSQQWQLDMLHATEAWRYSTGAGVIVAVVDSGVSANHPDLAGQVLPGLDLVREGDGTVDEAGHGTTVAALIAGRKDDREGVTGLAPDAKVLPIRVLDAKNEYQEPAVVAKAVVWAVDHGAKVINLSLGSGTSSDVLADAVDYAFARDVVVVACVGNTMVSGPKRVWHPAREAGVLAVTALSPDGKLWPGSLTGTETVIAAPGSELMGARPDGYALVEGTSFAAPLVSATAALIRSQSPRMSAGDVVQRLISTVHDAGAPGRDREYGFGVLDPVAALTADVPHVASNPLDTTPPPGEAKFGRRSFVGRHKVLAARATPSRVDSFVTASASVSQIHPLGLAAALAGFALLVGGGLTLLRRL